MPGAQDKEDKGQVESLLKETLDKGEKFTVRQVGRLFRLMSTNFLIAAVSALLLLLGVSFEGGKFYESYIRPTGARSIKYQIKFEKDGLNVQTTYDISVPVGGPDLIAYVQFSVEGNNLINESTFVRGQTRFNGTRTYVLTRSERDAPVSVSFSINSNQGWSASGNGNLRRDKRYDDVSFFD